MYVIIYTMTILEDIDYKWNKKIKLKKILESERAVQINSLIWHKLPSSSSPLRPITYLIIFVIIYLK